ncbi:amidohydrolase family protein [Anaerocellum danielii]|uniref:Amidohydrolase family protein n=1 Tax=Anaerocellum danielii TaxID=1387557 RepID=A0ABZ0U455_9FIRM|nr:amidohydrolase family protein [Caldicellulosiruptor danielii]WPX09254.1 amidohydrolase family protein [Caldicellulosiruptor danielii]
MIIDFHTHCFPDSLAPRAMSKLSQNSGMPYYHDGTLKGLKESVRKAGIDMCVVLPIATKPQQTRTINRWALSVMDENKDIICFGTIHPEFDEWQQEIEWLKMHGFKGIKFHPDYQDFFVDDKKMYPIYDAIFQNNMIILFHSGVDPAYEPPYHCTPKRLKKVLKDFPNAKIVAAHMGGYRFFEETLEYLIGEDVYLDTSFFFGEVDIQKPEEIFRKHGIEKILFATDSPWKDQKKEVEYVKKLKLTSDEVEMIFGKNAQELLKLEVHHM